MSEDIVGKIVFDNTNQQAIIEFQNHLIKSLNEKIDVLQQLNETNRKIIDGLKKIKYHRPPLCYRN